MPADHPALCDAEVAGQLQSELQCQAFARTDVPRKKPHPARDDLVYTTHIVNGNELARAEIEVPHVALDGCAERGFFDEAGFTVAGREKELIPFPHQDDLTIYGNDVIDSREILPPIKND